MVESSRIIPGKGIPSTQVTGAEKKAGKGALFDLTKSEGDIEDIKQKRSERTRLSRTKGKSSDKQKSFDLISAETGEDERPFITLLVDGQMWTIKHLCWA